MGLAISRQLVEAMGGQLTLQSTPGQGACFRFWLIAEPDAGTEAVPTARAEQPIPSGYSGAQRRILVVEDEPANRQVMLRLLQACGFAVLEAANGRAAVELMAGPLTVDLVLTDQFMADGDGWTVLQAVATRWPQVPVILMSAAPPKRPDGWPQALTYSAQLLKPLNHAELLKRIGELLALQWQVSEPEALNSTTLPQIAPHRLDDAELAKLRHMIAGGRVSEIIDWAAALESGSPGNQPFARAVSAAARNLDLVGLQALAASS
jgi:CheY-like chemotaxis protein